MEILANELAKLLNITVEKAIELYPVLKGQFVTFKILNMLSCVFGILWIVSIICAIMLGIKYFKNIAYIKSNSPLALVNKKVFQIAAVLFGIGFVGDIIFSILQYVLSPDFMLIKEFLMK